MHVGSVAELQEAWDALYVRDPFATPQSSFAWAAAWLDHWAADAAPLIVTVFDGGEPVGLAAFAVQRRGPLRVLRGLGEYPAADYWDILSEPRRRDEIAAAAAREVARAPGWDAIVLAHTSTSSPMPGALETAGLESVARGREAYPGIDLPSSFEQYLGQLPTSRRTNLRRRLRNLDEGVVTLSEVTAIGDVPAAVARWQELRVSQWQELGKDLAPEHSSPQFKAFVTSAIAGLIPFGHVAFWEFWHDERLVGSYIGLVNDRCFYQYLGGYDPAYAKLGIGKIAIGHGIRSSIEVGREYYDFMMGGEPYKYWYGASDRFCESYFFADSRLRSRAAKTFFTWRARLRRAPT